MNYKHAYHAGNFADVVKHILLVQLLNQLGQKNKPFYVLDAYGGRGLYSLVLRMTKKSILVHLGGLPIMLKKILMPACAVKRLKPKPVNTMH